jgi:Zn-dependent protease
VRTGELFGVRYQVHPGWLLVFALLLVSIASGVEGRLAPRPEGVASLAIGAIVVVLFIGTIVVHELAHLIVGRRLGLADATVSLLTMRRPSEPEPDPRSPGSELAVASSGPLISFAIAGGCLLLTAVFTPTGEPLSWLWWIIWRLGLANILLGAFHLVPVLPLDGGRIVRAAIWAVGGDLDRAGHATALVGRLFGYFVIGSGLLIALSIDPFYGIWIVLLGWFTTRLSRAAVDRRRMQQLTTGLTVDDATDRDPAVVPPTLAVETLLEQEGDLGQGVYPVIDGSQLVGVVFPSRLAGRLRRPPADQRVRDVLVPLERTTSLRPDEPLLHAVERLEAMRIDGIIVLSEDESGPLHGVVTRARVLERLRVRHAINRARDGSASLDARG